jgi:secreted PhoX family phosphatase
VNHEYTNTNLMFPGMGTNARPALRVSEAQARWRSPRMAAASWSCKREDGRWKPAARIRASTAASPARRRCDLGPRCRPSAHEDQRGRRRHARAGHAEQLRRRQHALGHVITCEENFNQYFGGEAAVSGAQAAAYKRYGIVKDASYAWGRYEARFDLDKEPNEPNRFGWIVEYDPYDPNSVPVKRTALGRVKHEGCTHAISADGRVVFYMGDDERFDYVYKFVTARPWNPSDAAANRDLLDEGTLYVAQLHDDGRVLWLPLVHGQGPLTAENGFANQGDVLVETRRAADLLKATPMDRPEDVETNPATGRVYVILTNNTNRRRSRWSRPNPRRANAHGHIVEIIPPGAGTDKVDHAATEAKWDIFLLAGKPGVDAGARYHRATSDQGWLSCPDNCAFDSKGRIWIATDGAPTAAGVADGLYAADTTGAGRALTRCSTRRRPAPRCAGPVLHAG